MPVSKKVDKKCDPWNLKEPLHIRLLRRDYPELEIPTPCILSKEHVIPALTLLIDHSQGKSSRDGKLIKERGEVDSYKIEVTSSHDGDSGGFSSNSIDVPITEELFLFLSSEYLITGKPEWGFTSDIKFLITKQGKHFLDEYLKTREEKKEEEKQVEKKKS